MGKDYRKRNLESTSMNRQEWRQVINRMDNKRDEETQDEETQDEETQDEETRTRFSPVWRGRPGESKIIYLDGDSERYIYGRIVDENDWGIVLKRDYTTHRFAWSKIKRIDEPSSPPTVRS